jgi:hypothetical protein
MRLVLEDGPPGPLAGDWSKIGDRVAQWITSARQSPGATLQEVDEDEEATSLAAFASAIASADPDYVPDMVRQLADADIFELAARCQPRTLLILGRDAPGMSVLIGQDRLRFASAMRSATIAELDGGHRLHSQNFDGFVGALEIWLCQQRHAHKAPPR